MNIAVFASGKGSNFAAIVKAAKQGKIPVNVSLLVCDNPRALVLQRADKFKIKAVLVERKEFVSKTDFEKKLVEHLKENNIELVVMAGFMRILSPFFISQYKDKILNIHPALLPTFKGAEAVKDAFNYGVKVTGVTVHFVDEQTDHGPIILQQPVAIDESDTLESLETKIHKVEHKLYPEAIRLFAQDRLKIKGRQVKVIPRSFPG